MLQADDSFALLVGGSAVVMGGGAPHVGCDAPSSGGEAPLVVRSLLNVMRGVFELLGQVLSTSRSSNILPKKSIFEHYLTTNSRQGHSCKSGNTLNVG